ncbi:cyclin-dependent kinase G-2-like [Aristolochia californica]|uniref:cyclin-dependent kinase G-2-like n=1 Tax=Aristolochia californica TaxID=171875 RepID=UPI0035E287C6
MGLGRFGGYHVNEFRDWEAEIDISRGKTFYYCREEFDRETARYRRRTHDVERERDKSIRDRVRVRQLDVKEGEVVDGKYHFSPNMSYSGGSVDRGTKQNGRALREVDREPGELSSGSGSDEPDVSESHFRKNKDLPLIHGARLASDKKRKFSPILWDAEVKQVNISSRNNADLQNLPLPPSPPLPHDLHASPYHSLNEAQPTTSERNSLTMSERSPVGLETTPGSTRSIATEPPAGLFSTSPFEHEQGTVQDIRQPEEGDYISSRNISASRWANGNNSPWDESEVSEDEGKSKKRKQILLVDSTGSRLNKKELCPELGELSTECYERARSKSSGSSGDGCESGSASEDEVELDENVYMELDEKERNCDAGVHQSDTDTLPVNDSNGAPSVRSFNMLHGCRSVDEFEKLNRIDEGTYGVVFRASDKKSGEIVALKKVKMEKEREGFPLTSLREINILLSCHHPSIVDVKEVVIGSDINQVFMVMEYMEHDLKGLMETMKQPFSQSEVKCLMLQLLEGIKYLHDNWVLHRDLKTSNLLLNNRGELKICDFGLARQYGSPLKPYTQLVVTLWYRAPELLLGAKKYSTAIDMWSLGCIMAELLSKEPLFSGKTEIDQLDQIFKTLGTPNEKIWPGFVKLPAVRTKYTKQPYNNLRKKFPPAPFFGRPILSEAGFDLLNKLLTYDPEKRITAEAALSHEWFREVPLAKSRDFMPTFPAQHAQDRRLRRIMKSPDPLEELRRKELQQGDFVGTGGLFG